MRNATDKNLFTGDKDLNKIESLIFPIIKILRDESSGTYEYAYDSNLVIIKGNGDVLCYHIYNRNEFEDYLINNTKLETASSSRHEFGTIYKEENQFYLKLNLQIRFLK